MSDSEMEEEVAKVDLSTVESAAGKLKGSGQSSIRLAEIGPRLTLKLAKVEAGMAAGDILYHAFGSCVGFSVVFLADRSATLGGLCCVVRKTPDQIAADAKARKEKQKVCVRNAIDFCRMPSFCDCWV